jgi:hypothetical protein
MIVAALSIVLLMLVISCGGSQPTTQQPQPQPQPAANLHQPTKVELGLGQKEGVVDKASTVIPKDFSGFLNCRVTWGSPLPAGTEIRFLWEMNEGGSWKSALDLKVNLDGKQDIAYSKVFRKGADPMPAGNWRVTIFESGSKLKEVSFTVQ